MSTYKQRVAQQMVLEGSHPLWSATMLHVTMLGLVTQPGLETPGGQEPNTGQTLHGCRPTGPTASVVTPTWQVSVSHGWARHSPVLNMRVHSGSHPCLQLQLPVIPGNPLISVQLSPPHSSRPIHSNHSRAVSTGMFPRHRVTATLEVSGKNRTKINPLTGQICTAN